MTKLTGFIAKLVSNIGLRYQPPRPLVKPYFSKYNGIGILIVIRDGTKKVFRPLVVVPLALFFGLDRPTPSPASFPSWWDLEVRLATEGRYRMDEKEFNAEGSFRFIVSWTGTMERDEADFRLFHNRSELVRWEAEERSLQPEGLRLLTAADFPEKPSFDFNFLLKQGGLLVFDLAAQGFSVPVSESPEKFSLLLPSSAENGQSVEGVDYNTGIRKGNNRVAVPAEDILKGPVEKKFAWDWKNEQWLLRQDRTLHILNQHTVKLTVIVRPHHETGLGPALASH